MNPNLPASQKFTSRAAFTLIEMMAVIAIIGILAGIVLAGAGYASSAMRLSRVQTELKALEAGIAAYKTHIHVYPPDNTNATRTAYAPLYYELSGLSFSNNTYIAADLETLTLAQVQAAFGFQNFINSSSDPSEPAQNFVTGTPLATMTAFFYVNGVSGQSNTLFGVPVAGTNKVLSTKANFNPWNYVSTNPTNNTTTYDLWVDIKVGSKVYRISNWSKDPQVVGP